MLRIDNRTARRLLIAAHGLARPPTGPLDVAALIAQMGYVQLDTIRAVVRAHDHILWSRNQNYREPMLWKALVERQLFEHFTHDASLLPIGMYGVWARQFARMRERFSTGTRWAGRNELHDEVLARVAAEGPLSTHAFDSKVDGEKEMWARPPHKRALDYLWYTGTLATSHREKFVKYYDLRERVIPEVMRHCDRSDNERLAYLCVEALDRLGIATNAELKEFWGAASAAEVVGWVAGSQAVPVEVEADEGTWGKQWAAPDIELRLAELGPPTSRLRVLSPFDPLVRDRKRLERVFGMDFRIEIFVPAEKRRWGYYVHPILEGDRFVGRIDLKADRAADALRVINFWPEQGVNWTPARKRKLDAELTRLARFSGTPHIAWE